jgi:hypothetical protein
VRGAWRPHQALTLQPEGGAASCQLAPTPGGLVGGGGEEHFIQTLPKRHRVALRVRVGPGPGSQAARLLGCQWRRAADWGLPARTVTVAGAAGRRLPPGAPRHGRCQWHTRCQSEPVAEAAAATMAPGRAPTRRGHPPAPPSPCSQTWHLRLRASGCAEPRAGPASASEPEGAQSGPARASR